MIDYSSDNVANTATNKTHTYHEQNQIDQTLRLREVITTLPPFVKDYFRAMEPKSSVKTRISYAYTRIIRSISLHFRIWIIWSPSISRNIWNILKYTNVMMTVD